MNFGSQEHFDQLQLWAKFRGHRDLERDYRSSVSRKLSAEWCSMWTRLTLADVPEIDRLMGEPMTVWPEAEKNTPIIMTHEGGFLFKDLFGADYMPTIEDIATAREEIKSAWSEEEEDARRVQGAAVMRSMRPSRRDIVGWQIQQRRFENGE